MIYGTSYEGATYECANCENVTNEHTRCAECKKPACGDCTSKDGLYCRDCGQELREDRAGELEVKTRRRAA
jgi:hypothetical protein